MSAPADPDALAHLRQDIRFQEQLRGEPFRFTSTWGLFSPREIDIGSRLLIDRLPLTENADCLDLGCGYGPIGVAMARLAPRGQTLLVDKDFVAVDYARRNLALNNIGNAEAQLGNGFAQIERHRRFDLIASNVPAKVGKELLTILLHDAHRHLKPGGQIYLVTINGLRQFMKRYLSEIFGNYDKVKQSTHYTVAAATRP